MDEEYANQMAMAFLTDILPNFEVCVRHAVEGVLDLHTKAPRGFKVVPTMTNMSSLTCIVQCWNTDYSLTLSVGINKTDLEILIPGMESEDMALDALGEVANVIAARVQTIPGFVEHFGHMAMSPPIFSSGGVTLKRACAIQGVLSVGSTRLYLGFSMTVNDKELV